jgi:2-(1,2-epoxy-1,2-dihydrophenyl)acetyl-CoA isomerase
VPTAEPADLAEVSVDVGDDLVATVEIHRPPNNFFDVPLIQALADAYERLDADPRCRAIVLCSEGKHFCAGANFAPGSRDDVITDAGPVDLYREAIRLFAGRTAVVAAVQGAAIGGGLGLACSADFRVASPQARFAANFARLGFHHGFALTVTLPGIVGQQHALDLLYTGRRIDGERAAAIGLVERVVPDGELRAAARGLAAEIAAAAPLAVLSIRETMRAGLLDRVRAAVEREGREQARLRGTADWAEGVRASAERREPRFTGR